MSNKKITYRRGCRKDLETIRQFVDFWLSGRAKAKGIKNAGNDYFVTYNQHQAYLKNCIVWLACDGDKLVGWGVNQRTNVMIHLLVAADYRGHGIGAKLLKLMNPDIIRSKSDQITGNPAGFYEKYGYMKIVPKTMVGKKKNIDLMVKKANDKQTHPPTD